MALIPLAPTSTSKAFRAALAKSISSGLTKKFGWIVFPDAPPVNTISKPTLLLERTSMKHGVALGISNSTYTVIVVSNQSIADTREDYLDDLVDDVTGTLDDLNVGWIEAQRGTFQGTNPCYSITVSVNNSRYSLTTTA